MDLGAKIKQLRQQCNLTQQELANRCELSKGYISQLENNLTSPSIATLTDVLTALGSNLKFFFQDETDDQIVFNEQTFIEKSTDDYVLNWLVPNAQKNMMEPLKLVLNPKGKTSKHLPHGGEEFGFCLEGEILLFLGKKKYVVKQGESFYFKADKTHYIANNKSVKAKFIWISTPPNF